jgi:hypothetical protein
MSPNEGDIRKERATYVTLTGLFFALLAVLSSRKRQYGDGTALQPFDFLLLGFATYRGGRLVAFDKVTEPFRVPFTDTKPDDTGAGEIVKPEGSGVRRALGELIACPICTGTWIAAFLVYGLDVAPRPTRILMTILAVSGVAELLDVSAEALTWTGQAAQASRFVSKLIGF